VTGHASAAGLAIISHGIDIVEVARVERLIRAHPERFIERVFTPRELADVGTDARRATRLAARFAAKEAAMKALGTGLAEGVSWHEVATHLHATGRPELVVTGRALEIGAGMGVRAWHVSLSHTRSTAIASVLAVG